MNRQNARRNKEVRVIAAKMDSWAIYIKYVKTTIVGKGQLKNCSERDIITRFYFMFMLYLAKLSVGYTVEWSQSYYRYTGENLQEMFPILRVVISEFVRRF